MTTEETPECVEDDRVLKDKRTRTFSPECVLFSMQASLISRREEALCKRNDCLQSSQGQVRYPGRRVIDS